VVEGAAVDIFTPSSTGAAGRAAQGEALLCEECVQRRSIWGQVREAVKQG
jgi:hypothetical protein